MNVRPSVRPPLNLIASSPRIQMVFFVFVFLSYGRGFAHIWLGGVGWWWGKVGWGVVRWGEVWSERQCTLRTRTSACAYGRYDTAALIAG